jgi:hypothetical protein
LKPRGRRRVEDALQINVWMSLISSDHRAGSEITDDDFAADEGEDNLRPSPGPVHLCGIDTCPHKPSVFGCNSDEKVLPAILGTNISFP